MPEPTVCTHPSAQRDVYRNNGRVFTYCRACDSDLTWTADIEGRRTKSPDRFMDARCGRAVDQCDTCSAIAERYGRPSAPDIGKGSDDA